MTITKDKILAEDDVKKRHNGLYDLDYIYACVTCRLQHLLHRGEICTRSNRTDLEENYQVWKEYREKIKHIVVWIKRARNVEKEK